MFDDHPLSAQLLPVQLVHSIVGITIILEFNKPIAEKKDRSEYKINIQTTKAYLQLTHKAS